jgi:hypothetical protein
MRRGDSGRRKKRVREVEDDPDMWASHVSGNYEKSNLSPVNVDPTCQGSVPVKSLLNPNGMAWASKFFGIVAWMSSPTF